MPYSTLSYVTVRIEVKLMLNKNVRINSKDNLQGRGSAIDL